MKLWLKMMANKDIKWYRKPYMTYCYIELWILSLIHGGVRSVEIKEVNEE